MIDNTKANPEQHQSQEGRRTWYRREERSSELLLQGVPAMDSSPATLLCAVFYVFLVVPLLFQKSNRKEPREWISGEMPPDTRSLQIHTSLCSMCSLWFRSSFKRVTTRNAKNPENGSNKSPWVVRTLPSPDKLAHLEPVGTEVDQQPVP